MSLSRLSNFIKSVRGTILYVDPNSLDSTDSLENSGNSLTRPFKTVQRALIEAAKFSYQKGINNDRFNKTTILVYPGEHILDNRPGYIPTSSSSYLRRSGEAVSDLLEWDLNTVFDLSTPDNALYKLNSIHGGIIVPRGVSIVGMDLRKTKFRPLYVPDPKNNDIERSCIFRVTGGCYFWQFTILDADPNGNCFLDYTNNITVPNFSHHKLSGFEYADGANAVDIKDIFLTYSTDRTDLDMYYEKVAAVYRDIQPEYGNGTVDIQPVVDEYRIVGSKGASVGISSIKSGGGTVQTSSTSITVTLETSLSGLSVDTPIQISGINAPGYDGQYVISSVINDKQLTYKSQNVPSNPNPSTIGATLDIVVDTVTSASPYIFNISLRSVYGMCGLLADGDKATGFKSMVVAQYTGIGLQKDDNAFIKYNDTLGQYESSSNLYKDSRSRFKPEYENYHIKATNDAFLQLVSIFAIGYAQHFVTENGGDIALNNSNSNFGAKALVSSGFKRQAFAQDDCGYITHIIPPKEIDIEDISVSFSPINVGLTTFVSIGAASTDRLYLYGETDDNNPPKVVIDGYHIGAKDKESLNIEFFESGITTTYKSTVVMPYGPYSSIQNSSEKIFQIAKNSSGVNIINVEGEGVITLNSNHSLINGESIRIISDNGHLPDGLNPNQIYYAIVNSDLLNNKIKIAKSLNDALNGDSISLNQKGGLLSVVSRVSDKLPGEIGHPIQWDFNNNNWYITVSTQNNEIYNAIYNYGEAIIGDSTSRSYVSRKPDNRSLIDTLYRVRYVIPKDSSKLARAPIDGFILQESNDVIGSGINEITQLHNFVSGSITNSSQLKNSKFIAGAVYSSGTVTITTEFRHGLKVGDTVEIVNVRSTNNTSGVPNVGYNGTYTVLSIPTAKQFTYSLNLITGNPGPGTFTNNTSVRDDFLPYFRRKKYNKTYQVYRTQEVQPYIQEIQDGIYYLTLINHSNSPTVGQFAEQAYSQPVSNLYPQSNRDNPKSDPNSAKSHSLSGSIGQVVINDPQNSITKETLESFLVGNKITNIISSTDQSHIIQTEIDHGFSGITSVSIVNSGLAYGSGSAGVLYNAKLVGFAGSTTGSEATAKITLGSGGSIQSINIIDGGSSYGIGNTLAVVGVATTTSHVVGVVRVEGVSNNINDTIQIIGVSSSAYQSYNTVYRISSVSVGSTKSINVISSRKIENPQSLGIGLTAASLSYYIPTGKALNISSFQYNPSVGLATVTFSQNHGILVNQKIKIGGSNEDFFNGDFIVKKINSLSSLVIDVGIGTNTTSITGSPYAYRPILTAYGGDLVGSTESISSRLNYEYGGVTTSLSQQITSVDPSDEIVIANALSLGFSLGDYLLIDNEIFRIKSSVTGNNVKVFRSVLGSPKQTHSTGSIVRKIKVLPVELRRNSIIRASGHTFEYLGFGPGNYSTSLPEKQNRSLTLNEKFLAQSTKTSGGIVVYTGMNSDGDFFAGNKKINSATGKEETFDTPIPTFTGEKDTSNLVNVTETQKLFVTESLRVDGGKDKNAITEFDGPVVLTNKLTSSSTIEANSLLLQGTEKISRKFSISGEKPTYSGTYGDIVFNGIPKVGTEVGWTYTTNNEWKPFGGVNNFAYGVGISSNGGPVGLSTLINFSGVGIAITNYYDSVSGISTIQIERDLSLKVTNVSTNAGILTCNFKLGTIARTTSTGIQTMNIINVPTESDKALNYNIILNSINTPVSELGNIQYKINDDSLTGIGNTLRWLNGNDPSGTSAGYYKFDFTILRIGSSWEVLGEFSQYQ